MEKNVFTELVKHADVEAVQLSIKERAEDGTEHYIVVRPAEDFLNETVPEGTPVNLVYMNNKIYSGLYQYVLDEDGQLVIYIQSTGGARFLYGLPYDKLVGYFKDSDV